MLKLFSIISTTFDGLIVKINVSKKNTTDTIIGTILPVSPIIGDIPISNVVAAVLGIAKSGPIHSTDAIPTNFAIPFPALDKTVSNSPPHFAAAVITSNAKPTSAKTNPARDVNQCPPDIRPKYGGNSKFRCSKEHGK